MNEPRNQKEKRDLYKKIGIWIVLSALVIVAFAAVVGTVFEKFAGDRAEIEEVVFLPVTHDHSRSVSTMSYSMAARYSDGSIGNLPEMEEILIVREDVEDAGPDTREATRGKEYYFSYSGNIVTWEVPNSGKYQITGKGASGGDANNAKGGKGRTITIEVELDQSQILKILVGQEGGELTFGTGWVGGGGGGTDAPSFHGR